MDEKEIRLECLKLAKLGGRTGEEILRQASEFEDFVNKGQTTEPDSPKSKTQSEPAKVPDHFEKSEKVSLPHHQQGKQKR